MKKKLCALVLVVCLICPLIAQAAQKVTFDIHADVFADAFPEGSQQAARDLQQGLSMFAWRGDVTFNEHSYAVIDSDIYFDGQPSVTLDVRSTDSHVEVSSNALGDTKVMLLMAAYLEFAMKPYHFLGLPTQYFALATSTYAHKSAWKPMLNIVDRYTAGEGTRKVSQKKVLKCAQDIANRAENDRAFRYWITAALMDIGLDDMANTYLTLLPDWVEENVGKEGLVITEENGKTTWVAGGKTLLSATYDDQGESYVITLPECEEMTLKATYSKSKTDFAAAVQFSSLEEGTLLEVKASASNLPNKEKQNGQTQISFSIGGEYASPVEQNLLATWTWTESDNAGDELQLAIDWLNANSIPMITLNTYLSIREGDDTLLEFRIQDLDSSTLLFSLYEATLAEFITKITPSLMSSVLPIYMKLPLPFVNVLTNAIVESGALDLLTAGEGEGEESGADDWVD